MYPRWAAGKGSPKKARGSVKYGRGKVKAPSLPAPPWPRPAPPARPPRGEAPLRSRRTAPGDLTRRTAQIQGLQKSWLGHWRIGRRSCGGGLVMATMGVRMLNWASLRFSEGGFARQAVWNQEGKRFEQASRGGEHDRVREKGWWASRKGSLGGGRTQSHPQWVIITCYVCLLVSLCILGIWTSSLRIWQPNW